MVREDRKRDWEERVVREDGSQAPSLTITLINADVGIWRRTVADEASAGFVRWYHAFHRWSLVL